MDPFLKKKKKKNWFQISRRNKITGSGVYAYSFFLKDHCFKSYAPNLPFIHPIPPKKNVVTTHMRYTTHLSSSFFFFFFFFEFYKYDNRKFEIECYDSTYIEINNQIPSYIYYNEILYESFFSFYFYF